MRKKIWELILAQLQQGASPRGLALACAIGVMMGNFPLMGTTTILCGIIGTFLRLNHPVLQAANYAMVISQLIMMPILLWIGETITASEHLSLNPQVMMNQFIDDKFVFLQKFGMAGLHAVLGWLIVAPILGILVFKITEPLFQKVRVKVGK